MMNLADQEISKRPSFLIDGTYRIFHITKNPKDESDDDEHHRMNENLDKTRKKSLKIKNRNGLKQLLFLHKSSCELSSFETKTSPSVHHSTNELCQGVIGTETKPKRESIVETTRPIHLDKPERINKKQVLINTHPEMRASFHRRRKRFIVACGTVLIALSIIITIIIYVIIMTVKYRTQVNRSGFPNHPR